MLAFEIARQLTNMGHTVENIILVDSFFNYNAALLQIYGHLQYASESYINSQYQPLGLVSSRLASNILLYKAQKYEGQDIEQNDDQQKTVDKIHKYYAVNTTANHLDEMLGHEYFNIKFMDHTHDSWIHDDAQIIEICNAL